MATRSQLLRRDQLLAALVEIRQNIVVEASGLSDEEQDQVFLGIWSIKHLLAHLTGRLFPDREGADLDMAAVLQAESADLETQTLVAVISLLKHPHAN